MPTVVFNDPSSGLSIGNLDDETYSQYLEFMRLRFRQIMSDGPVFETDADPDDLWEAYLAAFPAGTERQHHNCFACRHFIQQHGGLAYVESDYRIASALWHPFEAPGDIKPAIEALAKVVRKSKIIRPFLAPRSVLGHPTTGVWTHYALTQVPVFKHRTLEPHQAAAEKATEFESVRLALTEYAPQTLELACALLSTDSLYRSEKVLGQAEWLRDLSRRWHGTPVKLRSNVVWTAVAVAPAGFCHPRSSMIGTLLDDLRSGALPDDAARRFADKMHPLRYQRPAAPPSEGTIDQAEKLVDRLGLAPSLERRFASFDEVKPHCLWLPGSDGRASRAGVFGHLRELSDPVFEFSGAKNITWTKFRSDVLAGASKVQVHAGRTSAFTCLTTAVHASAPPILQWDSDEARVPFSWYFWNGGSTARSFSLSPDWTDCIGIVNAPCNWRNDMPHFEKFSLFILAGAKDTRSPGLALFPETLKSELRGIRAVIEKHSTVSKLAQLPTGIQHAAGAATGKSLLVRVLTAGLWVSYNIDRWE